MKLRKLVLLTAVSAGALTLSACGGGGGMTSTPAPPPTGGGSPTPSPPPSPPPSPTPPPSDANADLTGTLQSETFDNVASSASLTSDGTNETTSQGPITASIVYDADDQSYTLDTPGGSITFAPTDIDNSQSDDNVVVYSITAGDTTNTLTLTRPGTSGPITYQYVGSAFWQETTTGTSSGSGRIDSFVYGVETPDGNVPRTGSADYAIDLIGAMTVGPNVAPLGGDGTASIDFASGRLIIIGSLTIAPFVSSDSSFSGVADLSATTGEFSGTFTLSDFGQFNGAINGLLFGPNAEEIGGSFSVSNGDDRVATGTIMGRLDATPPNTQFNAMEPVLDNSQTFSASEAVLSFNAAERPGEPGFIDFDSIGTSEDQLSIRFDADTGRFAFVGDEVNQLLDPQFGFLNLGPRERVDLDLDRLTYTSAQGLKITSPDELTPASRFSYFVYGFETLGADLPTTGSAGYALRFLGTGIDPDYNADLNIDGTGLLRADFETGAIELTGGLGISENISLSGVPAFGTTAALEGTGVIGAGLSSFSGTLTIDAIGDYAGSFDGSFFGPTANETGGTFTAADDNGRIVGAFLGERDDALTGGQTLAGATEPVDAYALFTTGGSLPRGDDVRFDPDAGTYEITVNPDSPAQFMITLSPENIDQAASDDTFTVYTRPGQPGVTDRVFNPGDGNSTVALTYTSFAQIGRQMSPGGLEISTQGVFGVQTPAAALPQAGTATYDGVVFADGEVAATGYQGDITGTSTLVADFGSNSLDMTFELMQDDAMMTLIGTYMFEGTIANNGFIGRARQNEGFFGNLSGAFFGPNAEEMGATFDIIQDDADGRTFIEGVTVGRRR